MTKYVMTNNQDAERFIVDCKDGTEARHWIINNVDLSKEWNIKEDNFVAKNNLEGLMDIKIINNYLFFYSNTNQIIKKIDKETSDIIYKREKFSIK